MGFHQQQQQRMGLGRQQRQRTGLFTAKGANEVKEKDLLSLVD